MDLLEMFRNLKTSIAQLSTLYVVNRSCLVIGKVELGGLSEELVS